MNKTKLYWVFQIGGWTLYALFQVGGATIVANAHHTKYISYIPLITEAFFFLAATHIYRNIIIQWEWLQAPMPRLIPRVLISVIGMGLLIYFLRVAVSVPLGLFDPDTFFKLPLLGNTIVNTMLLFLWTVLYFIYHYFESYNLALKHEASLHEIELNQLKSQLNPHFIFNSLNSIRALVDEDPLKSKRAITQLSNILRNSLVTDKKRLTRLEDEIRTVQDYLSLETIRFEERLQTELYIEPISLDCLVPPLMVQTLVENGIKHGISKLKEGGKIELKTFVWNGMLKIEIRNSGRFIKNKEKKNGSGLGIENTKQRLKLIFGEEAEFSIFNENEQTVLTKLTIPQQVEYESANSRRRAAGKKRVGQFT